MKILFMGTPDFASKILEQLILTEHNIIGVVTQPDRQRGRGKEVSFSPVKEIAVANNFLIFQPEKIKNSDVVNSIRELNPDIIVVAAFGQILPKELLEIPKYGCINVHASLLPKYRGASPIQYSIIDGEDETGITIMYMAEGLDTGDIILQESLAIEVKETGGTLFDKMADLGAKTLIKSLVDIEKGNIKPIPQDNSKATYVKTISKEMGLIDFNESATKIERLIRGLNPWPSAYTYLDGKIIKIWDAEVINNPDIYNQEEIPNGSIVMVNKDSIIVKTGKGCLAIKEIQLQGKKRMSTQAFLLGYQLDLGIKFTSQ